MIFQDIIGVDQKKQLSNLGTNKDIQRFFNSIGLSTKGQRTQLDYINSIFGDSLLKNGVLDSNRIAKLTSEFSKYEKTAQAAAKTTAEYVEGIDDCDEAIKHYLQNNPTATTKEFESALKGIGPAAQQASVGTRVLATAMNAFVNIGISMAITGLIALIGDLMNAQNQLNSTLSEINETWKQNKENIEGYQEQVSKYRQIIADSKATDDEKREARQGLINVNKELIDQYGSEVETIQTINELTSTNIDLITDQTGAIRDQSAAWKQLEEDSLNATLQSSRSSDTWWTKIKNRLMTGGKEKYSVDAGMYQLENAIASIDETGNKRLDQYIRSLGGYDNHSNHTLEIAGDAYDLIEKLKSIEEYAKSSNADDTFLTDLSAQIGKLQEQVDRFGDTWQSDFLYNDLYSKKNADVNEEYIKFYEDLKAKQDEYNQYRIEGEEEKAEKLKQSIVQTLKDAEDKALGESKDSMATFFDQVFSDFDIDVKESRLSDAISEELSKPKISEDVKTKYQKEINSLFDSADLNKIKDNDFMSDYLVRAVTTAFDTGEAQLGDSFEEFRQDLINKFNSDWGAGLDNTGMAQAIKNNVDEILSYSAQRIQNYTGNYDFAGIVPSINEAGLNRNIIEELGRFKASRSEIYNNSEEMEALGYTREMIEAYEQILNLQTKYGVSVERIVDLLQQQGAVLFNAESLYSQHFGANTQNGLTSSQFGSAVGGMSTENQGMIETWGDTNWDSFMTKFEEYRQKGSSVEVAIKMAVWATNEAIKDQSEIIGETAETAIDYAKELEKIGINQEDFEAYVQNLMEFNEEYHRNKTAAEEFALAQLKVNNAVEQLSSDNLQNYVDILNEGKTTLPEYSQAVDALRNNLSNLTNLDFSGFSNIQIDSFINENLADLQATVDGDADAFERLKVSASNALAEASNQVTTLHQSLSDADFSNLMIDVGCNLNTDEFDQQFDQMVQWIGQAHLGSIEAQANLDDSPFVQALQDVIAKGGEAADKLRAIFADLGWDVEIDKEVQTYKGSVQSPRAEVQRVRAGNLGEEMTAKAVEQASISIEVPKSIRFKPIGTTVSPSSSSKGKSGGGGGGGGGGSHTPTEHTPKEDKTADTMDRAADSMDEAANAAKEAFELEKEEAEKELDLHYIDWIERLLDKLANTVKKWTDAANDFFTYWNKNMALNKAIIANHEELVAQEKAAKIYENHAKEAAQKAGRSLKVNEDELSFEIVDDDPLSQSYINKIKLGAMQIETLNGKQTALQKKIEEYITWYITCHFIW